MTTTRYLRAALRRLRRHPAPQPTTLLPIWTTCKGNPAPHWCIDAAYRAQLAEMAPRRSKW